MDVLFTAPVAATSDVVAAEILGSAEHGPFKLTKDVVIQSQIHGTIVYLPT